jgi:uncharacterized protein with NRDE domain
MCLILFSYRTTPEYRLILAANRDEFYERSTLPLAYWEDAPQVAAGRDVRGGGTWLGLTRNGRIAAVTNYRDPASHRAHAPSRGRLVSDFLTGAEDPQAYLSRLRERSQRYNGFNLLLGDTSSLWYYSNRGDGIQRLAPGTYGLSNRLLDTGWPKVVRGKSRLVELIQGQNGWGDDDLFAILEDREKPDDAQLPDTGVGLDWERTLSSLFITSPTYGTRSSSVVLIARDGRVAFAERSFPNPQEESQTIETRRLEYSIASD